MLPNEQHSGDTSVPPLPRKRVFLFAFLLIAALLSSGTFRHWQRDQLATEAQSETINFKPNVKTVVAFVDKSPVTLTLPGQTEPFYTAEIFPRATGYVAERRVDIGSRVKKGDLLIRIAAPDLDSQIVQSRAQNEQAKAAEGQAKAQLAQAEANLALAQTTSKRFQTFTKEGFQTAQRNDNQTNQVQSQQAEVKTAQAGIKVAAANTQGAGASLKRLQALAIFERVIAPFDGVVTARSVEVGDFVKADDQTGAALFTIAADKVLRVTVHVPQSDASAVRDGLVGRAYLPEKPEELYAGRVARNSVALSSPTRTLDAEVDVENPNGALKPGAFVNIAIEIPRQHSKAIIPAETLIFGENGWQVAVSEDDRVCLRTVTISRDFGISLEILRGVSDGDQIIVNPPSDLEDGSMVTVTEKLQQRQAKR